MLGRLCKAEDRLTLSASASSEQRANSLELEAVAFWWCSNVQLEFVEAKRLIKKRWPLLFFQIRPLHFLNSVDVEVDVAPWSKPLLLQMYFEIRDGRWRQRSLVLMKHHHNQHNPPRCIKQMPLEKKRTDLSISTSTAVNYFVARVEREFGQAQKLAATGPNLDVAHGRLWPNGCKWPWLNHPKMEAKKVEVANLDSRLNIWCWQCMAVTFLRHVQGGKSYSYPKISNENEGVEICHAIMSTQEKGTVII